MQCIFGSIYIWDMGYIKGGEREVLQLRQPDKDTRDGRSLYHERGSFDMKSSGDSDQL